MSRYRRKVVKGLVGVTHVVAICQACKWKADDYLTARDQARDHCRETGHGVSVEVGSTYVLYVEKKEKGK